MEVYKAQKAEGSENWVVINTETEEVKATHEPPEAEENAKRQAKLLNDIASDPSWDKED